MIKFNTSASLLLALSPESACIQMMQTIVVIPPDESEGRLDFSDAEQSGLMVLVL